MSLSDSISNILKKEYQLPDSIKNRNICDFEHSFVFNSQTKFNIIRKDTLMKGIPLISDSLFIYYTNDRIYANPNKGFFKRLFSWDWKKKTITEHQLKHTNDKFKFDDVMFMEIVKD